MLALRAETFGNHSRVVPSKSTEHLPTNFPATCSLSPNLGAAAAAVGIEGEELEPRDRFVSM